MKFVLITKKELQEIENIRVQLANENLMLHSAKRGYLYRIVYRNRSLKWFLKVLFNKYN